jgi:hypothetical protein
MTIEIPKSNLGDRILKRLGKKRAVMIPTDAENRFGPYVFATALKEPFLTALFRPRGKKPNAGWVYIDLSETD